VSVRQVVLFSDTRGFGGAERALLDLVCGLDRRRWRVVLAHHPGPGVDPLVRAARAAGAECWALPGLPEGLEGARRAPRLTRALRARRPDVFHAHLTWPLACKYPLAAAVAARVPAVVATHHAFPPFTLARRTLVQQRLLGRRLGAIVAVSEDTARRLRLMFGWPPEKLRVIRNAVGTRAPGGPSDQTLRDELSSGGERPVVLTVSRLEERKGHNTLLDAVALMPAVQLVLAGDGDERSRLEARAHALGIAGRVRFLGHRSDVDDLLACADVAVLPSHDEALPLTALEAMAAARPLVATDVGGTREAVVHGRTGLLVPPADPPALAAAMSSLLADRVLAARLGEAGRDRVHSLFSHERMLTAYTALYDQLLADE
jgi:glycosyltransferase involved in cell wall biosynthesis